MKGIDLKSIYMLFPPEQQSGLKETLKWWKACGREIIIIFFLNYMDHYQYIYSQATHFNILMKQLSDEDSNSVKIFGMPKIQSVEQELIKKT